MQTESFTTLVLAMISVFVTGSDTKSTGNQSNIRQIGLHRTKKLSHSKETTNRVKIPRIERERINHIHSKRLISKTRNSYNSIAKIQ